MIPEFGYAEYIWSSYAIAMGIVLWQALTPLLKHRQLIRYIQEDHLLSQEEHQ